MGMRADREFPSSWRSPGRRTEAACSRARCATSRPPAAGRAGVAAALEQVARLDATQARDQLQAILSGVADAVTAQARRPAAVRQRRRLELLGFDLFEELQAAPATGCATASRSSTRTAT